VFKQLPSVILFFGLFLIFIPPATDIHFCIDPLSFDVIQPADESKQKAVIHHKLTAAHRCQDGKAAAALFHQFVTVAIHTIMQIHQ
jgi:hypothetical protein